MFKRKSKTAAFTPWRPNFRQVESLPDIKVVRTDFLLNFVAVTVAAILLGLLVQDVYASMVHGANARDLRSKLEDRRSENTRNLSRSAEFSRQSRQVEEASAFVKVPVTPHDLLLEIASKKPKSIILSSLSYSTATVTVGRATNLQFSVVINATVSGTADEVTGEVDTFRRTLEESPLLKPNLKAIELRSLSRNPQTGTFNLALALDLLPAK